MPSAQSSSEGPGNGLVFKLFLSDPANVIEMKKNKKKKQKKTFMIVILALYIIP